MALKIALDWTPNTNHTGLFVAQDLGYYTAEGLEVEILSPDPSYSTTPARLVADREADLALCPSESCIAYQESASSLSSSSSASFPSSAVARTSASGATKSPQLQAIYAILQRDASAIASTKPRLAELGGPGSGGGGGAAAAGLYGSYNAKYEDGIVRAMVAHDGGQAEGMRIERAAGRLDLFAELRAGRLDATWVFVPWEGVEAELDGTGGAMSGGNGGDRPPQLHMFRPEDYGVPYGYSPVIARDASRGIEDETLKAFLRATKKGYEFALHSLDEAVDILQKHCDSSTSRDFLLRSQKLINEYYKPEQELGAMRPERWEAWVDWLEKQRFLKENTVRAKNLYTNDLLSD